jgi:hypothetical protein
MSKRNISLTGILRKMGFLTSQDRTLTYKASAFDGFREGTVYVQPELTVTLDLLKTMDLNTNPDRPFRIMEVDEDKGLAVISLNMEV